MARGLLNKTKDYLTSPKYRFILKRNKGAYDGMPDEEFLPLEFSKYMGYELDLADPKTFNEKLQWLKLYDRKDIYTTMADKYAVKQYVAEALGEQYIIPTLGVWKKAEEIDYDSLPEKFVLKTTHDSQGVLICTDKESFDRRKAAEKLSEALKHNYYLKYREWPYKNIEPRIIAEQYMEDESGELTDYKVHNFNGTPRVVLVVSGRFSPDGMTEDFYDLDWNRLDVRRPEAKLSAEPMQRPAQLDEILELSKKLSADIPFVRTDFYIINGQVYFGEMTFFPACGLKKFIPDSFDRQMGDWLALPEK